MTADLVAEHVAVLAERTALELAKRSKIDVELRAALETSQVDKDTVRIGQYAITRDDENAYRVRNLSGVTIASNLFYYETACHIVSRLNKTQKCRVGFVNSVIRTNAHYLRLLGDIGTYREQINHFEAVGQEDRAQLLDNRLSDAMGRAKLLRGQLLNTRL